MKCFIEKEVKILTDSGSSFTQLTRQKKDIMLQKILHLPFLTLVELGSILLTDKLRYIKNFKSLLGEILNQIG